MSVNEASAPRSSFALGGRLTTILVVAVTAVLIAVVAFVIEQPTADGVTDVELSGDVAMAAPAVGETAPDFKTLTVDGESVSLSDFEGKPVWLTFGATWCPDCRVEAPDLEATYQKFKDQGLVVLAVNIEEDAEAVKAYWARAGLTFPAVADPTTAIASRYRVLGIPTHYFIEPDGTIAEIKLGGLRPETMESLVTGIMD